MESFDVLAGSMGTICKLERTKTSIDKHIEEINQVFYCRQSPPRSAVRRVPADYLLSFDHSILAASRSIFLVTTFLLCF